MTPTVIASSIELGLKIKARRLELGLTIEDAAKKAGVGIKTWTRYEKGDSIRVDKSQGVLRVLKWKGFADQDPGEGETSKLSIDSSHEAWSTYLEGIFGRRTAAAFAAASDVLLDEIEQDLEELAHEPKGTHLGELSISWIADELPRQFLTRYDYEFLYAMRQCLIRLRKAARFNREITAHSVLEELILFLIEEQASLQIELDLLSDYEQECPEGLLGELCGDMDVVTFLYSDLYLTEEGDTYHFDRWLEPQFYLDR